MILHVLNLLESRGVASQANMEKVMQTVEEHTGMPIDISRGGQAGGQISLR